MTRLHVALCALLLALAAPAGAITADELPAKNIEARGGAADGPDPGAARGHRQGLRSNPQLQRRTAEQDLPVLNTALAAGGLRAIDVPAEVAATG